MGGSCCFRLLIFDILDTDGGTGSGWLSWLLKCQWSAECGNLYLPKIALSVEVSTTGLVVPVVCLSGKPNQPKSLCL